MKVLYPIYAVPFCGLQIREIPHKRYHKFIEYFDIRAAEAALSALNRSDIAGKQIKLERSLLGSTRRYCHCTLLIIRITQLRLLLMRLILTLIFFNFIISAFCIL